MTTKPNVTANGPGIIGQMYEDRKSKKRGVLESREQKYKTLMLRADDGTSFNITYSTFKSNWRKYNGDEVIQTSTQVEESKAKAERKKQTDKQIVEEKSEVVKKYTTEEKVKKVHALDDFVIEKIKNNNYKLKTVRNSKGGIIVRFSSKKTKLIDIWYKFNTESYEIVTGDDVINVDKQNIDSIIKKTNSQHVYKDNWTMKNQYKISVDNFESVLDAFLANANAVVLCKEKDKKKEEE